MGKRLKNCKWYAEFEGVCCNGDCKDFVADRCPFENQNNCKFYNSTNKSEKNTSTFKNQNIWKFRNPSNENEGNTRGFQIVSTKFRKHPQSIVLLPKRATKHSIAYDLYSPVDVVIKPHCKQLVWTDIKAYFGQNEALLINVRSSMGKHPIMLANTQGWVECDYYENPDNDGNIGVNLFNLGTEDYIIKAGDRIAQCMFINYLTADNGNTDTQRMGGFGSTN